MKNNELHNLGKELTEHVDKIRKELKNDSNIDLVNKIILGYTMLDKEKSNDIYGAILATLTTVALELKERLNGK